MPVSLTDSRAPNFLFFFRLRDSSGETAAVQSDSVLAESGFLQLDLPVGAATGPRVLELLQMPANAGEGEPEVLLSKDVEVEGAEPWLFLESDKPGAPPPNFPSFFPP